MPVDWASNGKFPIKRKMKLLNIKKTKNAVKYYQLLLKVNPEEMSGYTNLGIIAERQGNNQKAKEYYQQAIEVNPEFAEAYYNLGVLYWKEKKWQEVIILFSKTLELNPNHPNAAQFLTRARKYK